MSCSIFYLVSAYSIGTQRILCGLENPVELDTAMLDLGATSFVA
ncbi:MAG: hypothetical protein SFV15_24145 [Polyangiaceae bacterium]|nr:hypothetical protein [Polyangiaceae bacterium]